ncbi:MAG TPA: NAD-dependent epimerase/dehydratase family protein [Gemmataceae bacterium]
MRTIITGGAGFIGSHLCERFLARGDEVICVDNLITGALVNIEHLRSNERFQYIHHDISHPLEIDGPVDNVLHFASLASPADYLRYPIQTLKVGALGTHNTLGLAKLKNARFLLASTSEVYGDPQVHPQREDYWGSVNCVGVRGCYDESKRFAEAIAMAYLRTHGVNTAIVRIFNSVLGDQPVVLFNDDTMHLEAIEEYAEKVRLAPELPRQVFVPAFNPKTLRMEVRPASALIKHYAQQDAFELKLRYGRSIKVTGDHSVFVKGTDGQPVARPVRDITFGDCVAIPAYLPVVEKDRAVLDLAKEFQTIARDTEELWQWAIAQPSLAEVVRQRKQEIYALLRESDRYRPNKSRGLQVTLANITGRWIRRSTLPLFLFARLGLKAPKDATFGPYGGSKRFLPNRIPITPDLLWLFGFYLAEGSEHSGEGVHFISFCSDEIYLERAKAILEEHFRVHVGSVAPSPTHGPCIYAHSRTLHVLFKRLLGLRERRIPSWVMQLPLSRVKHFLEGFRCGDGTHSGKKVGNELCFDTTSKNLATDLSYLLLRFGILACFGQYETMYRQKYGDRRFPFYRITVCALDDFNILNWDRGVKQTLNAGRIGDLVWSQVRDIRRCVLTGHVYDFSVPECENFVAGNGVCAHNTYGPKMRLDDGRVLPNFMGQALRGEPLTIYGDGSQTRSFCFVDDLVEGIVRLLGTDFHEPVNLGNPDEVTILEFAKEILALVGGKSTLDYRPLPQDDPKVRQPDIARARALLGWEPRIDRHDGLKRTLAYFQTRLAHAPRP